MISICLKNNLRVPENIAVLGVDNDDLVNQGLSVQLSSVDSDQEGLGRAAARALQKLLASNSTASSGSIVRHPPKGVVSRLSTDSYAVANPLVANALHWIKTISMMAYRRQMSLKPWASLSKACKKHLPTATVNHLGKKSAISARMRSLTCSKQPRPTWTRLLKIAATTQSIL